MQNKVPEKNKSIVQLNKLIKKSRLHFYKPIQIAEILYHHRTEKNLNLNEVETFRNISKKWRDEITKKLVGSVSTSSQKFQDNIFDENAIPPSTLSELGKLNQNAIIEKYIYELISSKFKNLEKIISLCEDKDKFDLSELLNTARNDNDLRRSIDKIYEVIVYSILTELFNDIELKIKLDVNENNINKKYKKYLNSFLNFDTKKKVSSKVFRAGVANAADGGIDLWSNFGWLIQVKHLILDKETFKKIVEKQNSEKIIIICRDVDFDHKVEIKKLSKHSINILVERDLYDIARVITKNENLKINLMNNIVRNLNEEFPMIGNKTKVEELFQKRGYKK
tara:strand:- start:84 stop:1094 length:1011 start_codon:yes stop_codon:yes gene_type:complete